MSVALELARSGSEDVVFDAVASRVRRARRVRAAGRAPRDDVYFALQYDATVGQLLLQ